MKMLQKALFQRQKYEIRDLKSGSEPNECTARDGIVHVLQHHANREFHKKAEIRRIARETRVMTQERRGTVNPLAWLNATMTASP